VLRFSRRIGLTLSRSRRVKPAIEDRMTSDATQKTSKRSLSD
jgi:hypothetical protein